MELSSKKWRGYFLLSQGLELLQSHATVDSSWLLLRSLTLSYCMKKSYHCFCQSPTIQPHTSCHALWKKSFTIWIVLSHLERYQSFLHPSLTLVFSSLHFFSKLHRRPCLKAVSSLIVVILLAEEQWFSLGSAFLIIDTLVWKRISVRLGFLILQKATPGHIHDNRHHNEQWFRHQPVWQRVSGNACARRVTKEEKRNENTCLTLSKMSSCKTSTLLLCRNIFFNRNC